MSGITCCVCGESEHLVPCTSQPECWNYFHSNCNPSKPDSNPSEQTCPQHQKCCSRDLLLACFLANQFNSNRSLASLVTKQRNSVNSHIDLEGKLFWFGICKQYFSNSLPILPDLGEVSPLDSNSYLSQKISKTLERFKKLSSENKHKLSQLSKLFQSPKKACRSRPLDPILQVLSIPQKLKNSLIRNHEVLQQKTLAYKPREYHTRSSDETMVCAVCDGGESSDANLIVVCSRCQVSVHCCCYNIEILSDAEWHCDFCTINAEKRPESQLCYLCPIRGGAFILANQKFWVHLTCARYLTESVAKDWRKETVDVLGIDLEKFKLKCFSCNVKSGACVQCNHGRCITAFHVECRKDLVERNSDGSVWWLCPAHKAGALTRGLKEVEEKERNYIRSIGEKMWESREIENRKVTAQDSGKKLMGVEQKLEKISKKKCIKKKVKQVEKEITIKEIDGKDEEKRAKGNKKRKNNTIVMQESGDEKKERCKFVFEITEESVEVTTIKHNSIIKRIQYVNESIVSILTNSISEKGQDIKIDYNLQNLPVKRSKSIDDHEIVTLSTSTSNFKVTIKIPENYLKECASKLPKELEEKKLLLKTYVNIL